MCIILVCDEKTRPGRDMLETCWDNNPDGAGLMYIDNNRVIISKGYMSFTDFYNAVKTVPIGTPLVMHMRIGTSGGFGAEVTHPYPITRDVDLLHALDVECPVGIAHNGVLPYASEGKGMSDTVVYVRDVVAQLANRREVINSGGLAKSSAARRILKDTSKGSRLALLDYHGNVRLTGDGWETVHHGIRASNHSWAYMRRPKFTDVEPLYETGEFSEVFDLCKGCECCASCAQYGPLCDDVAYEIGYIDDAQLAFKGRWIA